MPDSGVFLDEINKLTGVNSYRIWFENLLKYSNVERSIPVKECVAAYPDELWKCMFAQYLYPFIKVPLFTPQSLYDSWSLYNILGIRCVDGSSLAKCSPEELSLIENYHSKTKEVLFAITGNNKNGAWAPVCINHCYMSNPNYNSKSYNIPLDSG